MISVFTFLKAGIVLSIRRPDGADVIVLSMSIHHLCNCEEIGIGRNALNARDINDDDILLAGTQSMEMASGLFGVTEGSATFHEDFVLRLLITKPKVRQAGEALPDKRAAIFT